MKARVLIILPLIILCTVCATNSELRQGVIVAKYFYFAYAMMISVAAVAIGYMRCRRQVLVIRYTDVAVAAFFGYVMIHHWLNHGVSGAQWYLFLLLIPLYFFVLNFTKNTYLCSTILISLHQDSD